MYLGLDGNENKGAIRKIIREKKTKKITILSSTE